MRIGYDLRALQTGSPPWGIGIYTHTVLENLLALDGENEYFIISHRRRGFDLEVPAIRRINLPRLPGYLNVFRDMLCLRREIRRCGLDVIHFTNPLQLSTDFDMGSLNYRTVITVYDLIPFHFPNEIFTGKRKPLGLIYRRLLGSVKKMPHIITISRHTKADLENMLGIPGERIMVIYPGVGEEYGARTGAASDIRKKYGLPERFIFYVGNFFPYKNLDNLFKALQILHEQAATQVPLVIGGRVHPFFKRSLDEKLLGMGLDDKVIFLGYIPPEDLPILYNCAEVFVYPSLYEGFGLPVLEAMASGAAVACSSASSLPEVAGDGALLFDPRSPEDMADALKILLIDRRKREDLREKGVIQAGRFSWEKAARETLELYCRISKGKQ